MRLTALHLTGLWLLFPETTTFYMQELKKFSLYGGGKCLFNVQLTCNVHTGETNYYTSGSALWFNFYYTSSKIKPHQLALRSN